MASRPSETVAAKPNRPLSPHLGVYKWGPAMTVSIMHRVTGSGIALVGLPLFAWWLASAAGGADGAAAFLGLFTTDAGKLNILGWVIAVGLTLALFQHLLSGVRHLFLDVGALFELKANRTTALLTIVGSVVLTALYWGLIARGVL